MTNTIDISNTAFAGESQAFQKPTACAKKQTQMAYSISPKLFEVTTQAELTHAAGHLKALDEVQSTLDNLRDAINGETCKITKMYPPRLEEAT